MKGCLKFSKYQIPFFIMMLSSPCLASVEKIDYWINQEFRVSTLSKQQQVDEILWFVNAAKPYQGLTIRVVSEELKTHWYEANVLAKAFSDITGINVIHEITDEDDVIKKVIAQGQLNESIYDAYVTDSDLIGFYYRSNQIMPISEFIENDGKLVTLPTLDLDDFLGIEFVTAPNGVVYQLPTQQFANLYWFRYDWFNREELQVKFKKIYGYDLGVPKNWSAYEDIAEFFSFHVKEIDGVRIYGHMDYGKYDPSLGWRFSDSWLSMAGMGDKGLPNGLPVDDWGIRVENGEVSQAIVALGRQDVCVSGLKAPNGIKIMSSTSDHLVLESSQKPLFVGEKVTFSLDYSALLSSMSSRYIHTYFKAAKGRRKEEGAHNATNNSHSLRQCHA